MTLPQIIWNAKHVWGSGNGIPSSQNTDFINVGFIVTACPELKQTARAFAELHYEAVNIGNELIKRYLLQYHEYDAVDISRIISLLRKETGNG